MLKTINDEYLIAIGAAIRSKNGTEETYKPKDMAAAIEAIEGDSIIGNVNAPYCMSNCSYMFSYNNWNWTIETFGNKIKSNRITNCNSMFSKSNGIDEIPFEINCTKDAGNNTDLSYMFNGCEHLNEIPKINNCRPLTIRDMFSECKSIRYFPEDIGTWFDWSYIDSITTATSLSPKATFQSCFSLRKAPMCFLEHGNAYATASVYSPYQNYFANCYCLDEIKDIPIFDRYILNAITNNLFSGTFGYCGRVKDITFKSYATDTVPVRPVKWKSQTIDLSIFIGYLATTIHTSYITDYFNSGITMDKRVVDDATYQALKDDPDYWTTDANYSRYNHDSAVRTIKSLPDTSTYLSSAGGTNTIKFEGDSGKLTDAGAINTLTDAEIAIAAAKGWTVSFR